MFSSVPQPQNPEGNSYAVSADHLAPFSTYSRFVGFTNGFFLYYDERLFDGLKGLVTPSTGQSLTLPRLKWRVRRNGRRSHLLGYDPIAKEFKVLSMAYQSNVAYHIGLLPSLYASVVTEKFSCVKFSGISSKAKPASQTLVNYNGKLGLLMSEDFSCVYGGSKSFELWVLRDAAKHEWFTHVYVLPLLWKAVVTDTMCFDGMVGTNEIVYCRRATETCIPMSYTTMSRARRSQKLESKELKPFRVKNVKLL
ncbi:BnaC04g49820D [Brassica napus]|uniref:(rape) hypothetical protein n=1 Tax=Brassica napus TaxID=3708 RepID=A0A078GDL6_BRANA|nr:unnamed protein product [Brassica napus]CDY23454.1 BnaC04g49820D [Brassica napus]